MMDIQAQPDGRFAVRDIGGAAINPIAAVFDTLREAEEWMLQQLLLQDQRADGLGTMLPGGNQGLS